MLSYLFLACAVAGTAGYHKMTEKPTPERDRAFIEAARKNTMLPWTTRPNGSNISQEVRNKALAEVINQGCQNLDRVKYLAEIAELDKPVVLESDKKSDTKGFFSRWFSFSKPEQKPQTPLARAQATKNQEIIKILQELNAQKSAAQK